MCEVSLKKGIALNCQVKNCKTGFSGRETARSRSLARGELLAWALKENAAPGDAELVGR